MPITIIAFIVILSILVLIHEFGHFITAKKMGIKVEEFGFGFPPRLFGIRRGETIYSLNLLPFGGFVKLFGEDAAGGGSFRRTKDQQLKANRQQLKRAFYTRSAWQRAIVVLAGVVMNFVLAVVLISFLFTTYGVALPTEYIKVVEVLKDSPAASSGIKAGDKITEIDGRKIKKSDDFIKIARDKAGQEIELKIIRDNKEISTKVVPRRSYPADQGPVGIAITNVEVKKYPWYQAPIFGTLEAFKFSYLILSGIIKMFANLIISGAIPEGFAGPVGVAQLTGQAVSYGLVSTLWFVALLSLNLAVLNVLPIPALDGGRLFFIIIEMISGRRVHPKYEALAHAVGFAVLLALIIFVTFFDIMRILSGKSILPGT